MNSESHRPATAGDPDPVLRAEPGIETTPVPSAPPVETPAADPELRGEPAHFDLSAHKYELNPPTPTPPPQALPAYEDLGELPHTYASRKVYLIARDPHRLFCYWDMGFDMLADAERAAHDGKVFLELFREGTDRVQQIQLPPWSREWILHVGESDTAFHARIGFYRADGSFETLGQSPRARTPRDRLSDNTNARFVTLPFQFSFGALKALVDHLAQDGEDLAETLARLQGEGFMLPFEYHGQAPLPESAREQLLSYLNQDIVRRHWRGSEEIVELLQRRTDFWPSSGQWAPSSQWMTPGSLSSPFGGSERHAPREFFFHVNAELIIYGGTHPDATVRINGETIPLQPDGTFHYHFNFADGKFHIPLEATSPDGRETRHCMLSFLRLTAKDGGVDATPQDPSRPEPLGRMD